MSARTELLLEQIARLKAHAQNLEELGEDPHSVNKEITKLVEELNRANQSLNEGVLKG